MIDCGEMVVVSWIIIGSGLVREKEKNLRRLLMEKCDGLQL